MRIAACNARALQEAIEAAEDRITTSGRAEGGEAFVELVPSAIELRPELFQPREFSFGLRQTDPDHVKKLARAISIQGELDPVLVIKVGKKFICVDGHHRLEAYKAEKWTKPIKCEWFGGNVRAAVDESMARNAKDRLNIPQSDRLEAAWKRVLLDWGSKAQIVRLCCVGEGTVAQMRRVKERWNEQSELGDKFRARLGFTLFETSCAQAKLAWLGAEAREIDDELQAERLARRMRARLTNLLSREPKVTARALELYDPALAQELAKAWGAPNAIRAMAEQGDEHGTQPAVEILIKAPLPVLEKELETCRKRIGELEAEVSRRAAGGTPSDLTWAEWVQKEQPLPSP
jgi:hypothetical protein